MNVNAHFQTDPRIIEALRAIVEALQLTEMADQFGPVEKAIEKANILVEELEGDE